MNMSSNAVSATLSSESTCFVHNTATVVVKHEPLTTEKVISGAVTTGATELGQNNSLQAGVWEHSVGVSTDVEADEVFVILSGKGRVHVNGTVLELYPGVVGILTAGAETRWEIDETIRKVYVFPR
jgi:uncharacterized cupin superfamily protein